MQIKPQPVTSAIRKIIVVGTHVEIRQSKDGLRGFAGIIPIADVCTTQTINKNGELPSWRQKTHSECRRDLFCAISKGDSEHMANTLVITDVGGESRLYPFEKIVMDTRANFPNVYTAVLTSEQACIGTHAAMDRFVKDRGHVAPGDLGGVHVFSSYGDRPGVFKVIATFFNDLLCYQGDKERIILVVEDQPQFYTPFLAKLHSINDGRARVLLARTFEEAEGFIRECHSGLAGAILDVQFPKGGKLIDEASFPLLALLRKYDPRVPVVFQSSEKERLSQVTSEHNVLALHKQSPTLLTDLESYMNGYFGFGSFTFRYPDGRKYALAETLSELVGCIREAPAEVLLNHGTQNDFSKWLWLHGEKKAADRLKPIQTSDAEEIRSILLGALEGHD